MENEKNISLDGNITQWREADLAPELLLGRNWIYSTINTFAHRPLHLSLKLRYALASYKALFGYTPQVDVATVEREIYNLLHFGLFPEGGNTVNLYLIPDTKDSCRRLITHEATTPYEGYGLLAIRPRGVVVGYDIPFGAHQTNVSLTTARFADNYAALHGYDIALRSTREGILLSSGDNPLFALRNNTLLTTPADGGARLSAEREIMLEVAAKAGVEVKEEVLSTEEMDFYEELMVFTPVGIQSLRSLGNMRLGNIYATRLGKFLNTKPQQQKKTQRTL